MALLPRFMICENPISDDEVRGEFILHTQEPEFLAVVLTPESPARYLKLQYPYFEYAPYIHNDGFLTVYVLAPIVAYNEEKADDIPKVLRRMSDWWRAYLKWEDSQTGKYGKIFKTKPYSDSNPHLCIISDEKEKRYIVINCGLIQVFGTETETKEYLRTQGIFDENGIINIFTATKPGLN